MFDTLGERLNAALDGVRGSGNLTEDQVKKVTREIRLALLEADVNYAVVKEFVGKVRERATGAEVSKALSPGQQIVKIVNEELADLMGGTAHKLTFASRSPTVVMLAGLNGHGKTTVAGKLALFVRKLGKNPYLIACDTYRPAAIEQLQQIGRELGVPVASEGEKMGEFDYFYPDRMAGRILGMGDVLTLIEKAEDQMDRKEAESQSKKLMSGKFDFEDFLKQMQIIKKMGPLSGLLGMIPGLGKQLQGANIDNGMLGRVEAMITSMTAQERRNPRLLQNPSRARRIARGSGTTQQDVQKLVKQFSEMQKMMKQMGKGGMPRRMPKIPFNIR